MEEWDKKYPVSDWECIKAQRIERIQGNSNRYIKERCESR